MKTEEFDDIIRSKFDEVNQKFDEQEVDKVFNYIRNNFRLPFWDTYSSKIIYLTGISTIAVLITWNISQHFENKDLKHSVDKLQKEVGLLQTSAAKIKSDTVFITKYKYQTIDKSSTLSNNTPEVHSKTLINNVGNLTKTNESKAQFSQHQSSIYSTDQSKIMSQNNIKPSIVNNQHDSVYSGYVYATNPENTSILDSKSTDNNKTGNTFNDSVDTASKIISGEFIKENDTSNVQIVSQKNEPANTDSIILPQEKDKPKRAKKEKSVLSETARQIGNAIADAKISFQNNPGSEKISLRYLNYRGGIGIEKANGQLGIDLIGEVLWSKRWSISSGVKLLNINNETYNDANEFHSHKGMHFEKVYENQIDDTANIKNIGMRNMILQVPVAINYHLRFNNNYAFVFSLGTDLDLYAKQYINFEHHENIQQPVNNNFNITYPVVVFNNINISAGVQKQWKHFVFQIKPFISPQLKSVVYKKEDLYFGLKFNVLFTTE
jgi:hypothetical protein